MSQQPEPKPQLSPEQQAVKAWEAFDNFATVRNNLHKLASWDDEYGGIPMPLKGLNLVLEKRYKHAKKLLESCNDPIETPPDDIKVRNIFRSRHLDCSIAMCEENGKIFGCVVSSSERIRMTLDTYGGSYAWGLEQEQRALQKLATLINHYQMKMYVLTGGFAESSKRSKHVYIFRRLRPTLVMEGNSDGDFSNCTTALCLHPIGYYEGTFAGVMCPTDEVIAHLMLMRGDEHGYWKQSGQHNPKSPQAGL